MRFRFMKRRRSRPIRVVLADDQPEVLRALTRYFGRDDRFHIAGEAEDGAQAVRMVGSENRDAVILDLAMPNMDGLEAIREIAQLSPATAIVVLSSVVAFGDTREKALELGAHAVFDKYTRLPS